MQPEESFGKSQVRFPRWVFWDGIFTAISQTNTLKLLFFQDNPECHDMIAITRNDSINNTDHFDDNDRCDKTCETAIGITLVLVGQVYQ